MKVLDILFEAEPDIKDSNGLAAAFKPDQWYNIIAHFASKSGKPISTAAYKRINDEVGSKMYNIISPAEWNVKAAKYNMHSQKQFATWNDIYQHLKPHADKKAAAPEDEADAKPRPLALPTKETFEQFQTWAKGPDEFTDRTTLRNYLVSLSDIISAKRSSQNPEWEGFLNAQRRDGKPNNYIEDFKKMSADILNTFANSNKMAKRDVDSKFYAWLNTVDLGFDQMLKAQSRNNSSNQPPAQ